MPSIIKVDQIQSDTGNVAFTGNVNIDSGLVYVDGSNNRVMIGSTSANNHFRNSQNFTIVGVANTNVGMALTGYVGTSGGHPIIDFQTTRSTSIGSLTKVESGDALGVVVFRGSDGNLFYDAAFIRGEVDGATGSADMPGRLGFYTTPDGSGDATEKMRIDNAGRVTMPSQVGFRVGRDTDLSVASSGTYTFNVTSGSGKFNTGSHYNSSTGVFTAPVAGRYLIASTIIAESVSNPSDMTDMIRLSINGNLAGYSIRRSRYVAGTTGTDGYFVDFIHAILNLSANDQVSVSNGTPNTVIMHNNGNYNIFEGFLLG